MYLDANNNSKLDAGELSTLTQADGTYSFSGAPSGAYIVRQVLPVNQKQTSPVAPYGLHITIVTGQTLANENFVDASTVTASIAGVVFNDLNANLKQDVGELGLSGWTVYLDLNNTGSFVTGDPVTTTDANGNYIFYNLRPGAYIVRVVPTAGYSQTTPTMNYGQHETVGAGNALTGAVFGERKIA